VHPIVSKAKDFIRFKNANQAPMIAHISYRSRALQAFSDNDLRAIEAYASNNNKKIGVTGIFLYNDGEFFQAIEGPPEQLEGVWAKISADERHSITEVQKMSFSPYRMYSGWNMKLFKNKQSNLNINLSLDSKSTISDILADLIREDIWPELQKKHALHEQSIAHETYQIDRLAHHLLTDPSDFPEELLQTYFRKNHTSIGSFYTFVIGPLAGHLGDLSATDVYSEFEVTIALSRALCFFRKIRQHHTQVLAGDSPKVLVAHMPGETHIISSVMDYEILWQAGMNVSLHFAKTDEELLHYVQSNAVDVLDLSQSPTLFKATQLPRLKTLIENIHAVSINPKIRVILKGRGFSNLAKNQEHIGADLICNVSIELTKDITSIFTKNIKPSRSHRIIHTLKTMIH